MSVTMPHPARTLVDRTATRLFVSCGGRGPKEQVNRASEGEGVGRGRRTVWA
jgi:hypothetical protein